MSATNTNNPPRLAEHQRYVSFDLIRQLPQLIWNNADFRNTSGPFQTFYASNKLYSEYVWQFHYFCAAEINSDKALLLIHESQAKDFIQKIKARFPRDQRIALPDPAQWPGVVIDFGPFPGVQPRLLTGQVKSRNDFVELIGTITPFELDAPTKRSPELMEKLRVSVEVTASCANKRKKEKQQDKQRQREDSFGKALHEIQAALGLREAGVSNSSDQGPLKVDEPASLPFHRAPIIICVDVEAHESMHSVVTEIGIATLDTNDLHGILPGPLGVNWRAKICARHLRTAEYRHHVNSRFVKGCPNKFEFGESEFVPINDLARVVSSCFRPPYSGTQDVSAPTTIHERTVYKTPTESETRWVDPAAESEMAHNAAAPYAVPDALQKRNIIFLGHDADNDIAYLRRIGYDLGNLSNLVHVADTCTIYSAITKQWNKVGLNKILTEIGIDAWHLHNAGNDAWYTMAAAIGLGVGEREGRNFGDQASSAAISEKGKNMTGADSASLVQPTAPVEVSREVKLGSSAGNIVEDDVKASMPRPTPALEEEDLISFDDRSGGPAAEGGAKSKGHPVAFHDVDTGGGKQSTSGGETTEAFGSWLDSSPA